LHYHHQMRQGMLWDPVYHPPLPESWAKKRYEWIFTPAEWNVKHKHGKIAKWHILPSDIHESRSTEYLHLHHPCPWQAKRNHSHYQTDKL
jgi:hypothetical protein